MDKNILEIKIPIEDNLEDWIAHLAYIPQDVFLIDDTLKCNIALGLQEDEINDERIKESLRQSQLINFIELIIFLFEY